MCEFASSGGLRVPTNMLETAPSSDPNTTPCGASATIVTSPSTMSVLACGIATPYCMPVDNIASRSVRDWYTESRPVAGILPVANR